MSIVYSQLYVASKILKSVLHNMKFILGNCHVVMSMDIYTGKLEATKNNENTLTQI